MANLIRNRDKKNPIQRFSDGPTKEYLEKHRMEIVVGDNGVLHQRVVDAVVIETLWRKGTLCDDQLYTAQRLYADWYHSAFSGVPAHMKSEVRVPVNPHIEASIDATERYKRGLALLPMKMEAVVTGVVIENRHIKDASRRAGCHRDIGRARLQDGLDILTGWYARLHKIS